MRYTTVLLALCTTLGYGCGGLGYLAGRGRDLADVITVSAGTGIGLKARVGPLCVAPAVAVLDLTGVQGGEIFYIPDLGGEEEFVPLDVGGLWWNTSSFHLESHPRLQRRGKAHIAGPVLGTDTSPFSLLSETPPFISVPRMGEEAAQRKITRYPWAYHGQIEFLAALGVSLRVGLNAAELIDFLAGWTTFDLLADDKSPGPEAAGRR